METGKIITVVFVEDNKPLRESLVAAVNQAAGFSCIGSFSSAEAAIKGLSELAPDVAVLDIHLPRMSGIRCLHLSKPLCPHTKFMMLTAYEESENIFQALLAGAGGYLLKQAGTEELLEAIRLTYEGGAPMSQAVARQVVQHFNRMGKGVSEVERLTPREFEVLELLARGNAAKEVADKLSLSIDTVRMYTKQIYTKLGVHSRGQAITKFMNRAGQV